MDLVERIVRRQIRRVENRLVVDRDALNPTVHLLGPVGREGLCNQLLDVLDPLFEESLPPDAYVWGPSGAGKTAIVTTLLSALEQELTDRQPLYTATRAESRRSGFGFAYLDARRARSEFRIYRQLLDELRPEPVPERGLGTDDTRADIESEPATTRDVVVAVDHLGEPETVDPAMTYNSQYNTPARVRRPARVVLLTGFRSRPPVPDTVYLRQPPCP